MRCNNTDPAYFYPGSKGIYCRKCIRFKRILLEEEMIPPLFSTGESAYEYSFSYPLTSYQKEASRKCLEYLKDSDVLLYAVTGAGKTEIVCESISAYLKEGKKVCYAIARKEVVIELSQRFSKIFPRAKITAVYGDHHEVLTGDLIVCTAHQLYRYHHSFDLLILDEADAFPLKGDTTLMNIALNSSKSRVLFSTATRNEFLDSYLKKRQVRQVDLFVRPTLRKLSIPRILYSPKFFLFLLLFHLMHRMTGPCIIFVSRKEEAVYLSRLFGVFFRCTYVYADLKERREHIEDFRSGKVSFIFSTTVLERGITIPKISCIILFLHENSFDSGSLIQMIGRIGRSPDDDHSKAYLLSCHLSKEIRAMMNYLKEANRHYEVSVL